MRRSMPAYLTVRRGAFGPGSTLADAKAWLTRKFETDARRRWNARWEIR